MTEPAATVPIRRLAAATALTGVVFGVLDALWLGVVSGDLYDTHLGHLLAAEVNVGAAAAFYVVYVLGLVWFVVRPGLVRAGAGARVRRTLVDAAAFGFVTYATFDLTSMAVFRDVPLVVVAADLAWGVVVCTATIAIVLAAVGALSRRADVRR